MGQELLQVVDDSPGAREMMLNAGYSQKAVDYYFERPYMGTLADPDQVTEFQGTCGDTMRVYLKIDGETIQDIKYEVYGCAGAISAAMAAVDIVKGASLDRAKLLTDGDIFKILENIPEKKHHCIQLAVKTLHLAVQEYRKK
jgi:nitrogen fixation NifU-like protein